MATLGVEFVLLPSKVALVPMTKHSFIPQLRSLSPSLFVSQFTRSAPILCFKRNFVLSVTPWVCQPQIMPANLSVRVGISLPFNQGFRWKLSRYWVTGIRMLFPFIFRFHLLSDFNQLISLLRVLFHTALLYFTLGFEC